jgi:peptidoglycan/LPS O-acetylase OafA/YrhL
LALVLHCAPALFAVVLLLMGVSPGFAPATSLATLLASPYQLEFLLGCAVALLAAQRWPQMAVLRSSVPLQFGLLLIALVLLLLPLQTTLVYRFVLLLVLSALILFSSVRDFDQLPALRSMAGVGVVSFSLYLLHNPVAGDSVGSAFIPAGSCRRSVAGAPASTGCCALFPLRGSLVASPDAACSAAPEAQLKLFYASLPALLGHLRRRWPC